MIYIKDLARRHNASDFAEKYINEGKSISYYGGRFVIYDPYNVLTKWEERLNKLTSKEQ